jgi:hypothetical protein
VEPDHAQAPMGDLTDSASIEDENMDEEFVEGDDDVAEKVCCSIFETQSCILQNFPSTFLMPRGMASQLVELILHPENMAYIVDNIKTRNKSGNVKRFEAYKRVQSSLAREFPGIPVIPISRIKSKWTTEQRRTKKKICEERR